MSGCGYCGNGRVDAGEACDGNDLGGATCASEGFGPGTLDCTAACQLDTSGCSLCGNGVLDSGEACDGSDLGGQTCADQGFDRGVLACGGDCTFDTSGCVNCGSSDTDPPVASNHVPAPETQGAAQDTPIQAVLYDPCDVDTSRITLSAQVRPKFGADYLVPLTPVVIGTGASVQVAATPTNPFPRGAIVTVTLTAADMQGNALTEVWRFSVVDEAYLFSRSGVGLGSLDNGIDEARPDANDYLHSEYPVGGSAGAETRYLVRFHPDTGVALPAGSVLFGAILRLGVCGGGPSPASDVQVDCYRLNAPSRAHQATWRVRQGAPGPTVLWAVPGADGVPADREGTPSVSVTVPAATPAYTEFSADVAGLVQDWMGGAGYYGLVCASASPDPVFLCASSSNYPPVIHVTFGPPLP